MTGQGLWGSETAHKRRSAATAKPRAQAGLGRPGGTRRPGPAAPGPVPALPDRALVGFGRCPSSSGDFVGEPARLRIREV